MSKSNCFQLCHDRVKLQGDGSIMITVREFRSDDAPECSVVQFESFKSFLKERMEYSAPRPAEFWEQSMRRNCSDDFENITFVAEKDGRVIGFISITAALKRRLGTLVRIGVLPECAGGGVGRMLFEAAEKFWKERNMRKIATCVSSINPTALKFYQRCGFHVEGILKDHFFEKVDEYQLAKFYR